MLALRVWVALEANKHGIFAVHLGLEIKAFVGKRQEVLQLEVGFVQKLVHRELLLGDLSAELEAFASERK